MKSRQTLISPEQAIAAFPCSPEAEQSVSEAREQAINILSGKDKRLLVIVGPCSVHDPIAALEYAQCLKQAITQYSQQLHIIMRVYFEKPRTTIGWKGLINDPHLDGSHAINEGILMARKLLRDITNIQVPTASEFIDTFSLHYIHDFIAWGAIGARTSESRLHRELASGLGLAIGFKNSTDGNTQVAIDAVETARHPHHFFSINAQGMATIIETSGNPHGHVILRGSNNHANYDAENIEHVVTQLQSRQLPPYLIVDCSHGNSGKTHLKQIDVSKNIADQIASGNRYIAGVMLESFLEEGKQIPQRNNDLKYGQSITDACLSWQQTLPLLKLLANSVELREKILI